eukprot:TRINITY_DN7965_c0_g2_i6.p1 TRINITY_DN7965_c0_g2~~TRINITY_DN7965_c0_g2_i6.p1  ORF type:complete len:679 (+),score=155.47 TRINITY_DN7965_c0_g2_i6:407-2443(+)
MREPSASATVLPSLVLEPHSFGSFLHGFLGEQLSPGSSRRHRRQSGSHHASPRSGRGSALSRHSGKGGDEEFGGSSGSDFFPPADGAADVAAAAAAAAALGLGSVAAEVMGRTGSVRGSCGGGAASAFFPLEHERHGHVAARDFFGHIVKHSQGLCYHQSPRERRVSSEPQAQTGSSDGFSSGPASPRQRLRSALESIGEDASPSARRQRQASQSLEDVSPSARRQRQASQSLEASAPLSPRQLDFGGTSSPASPRNSRLGVPSLPQLPAAAAAAASAAAADASSAAAPSSPSSPASSRRRASDNRDREAHESPHNGGSHAHDHGRGHGGRESQLHAHKNQRSARDSQLHFGQGPHRESQLHGHGHHHRESQLHGHGHHHRDSQLHGHGHHHGGHHGGHHGQHYHWDDDRQQKCCDALRTLILRHHGDEDNHSNLPYDARPKAEEVKLISAAWRELVAEAGLEDDCASIAAAEVDGESFVDCYARRSQLYKALAARSCAYLLRRNHRSFTREDIVRLVWPKSREEDIQFALQLLYLQDLEQARMPTPRLMPKRIFRELAVNFRHICGDRSEVRYEELCREGLVDEEGMINLRARYDADGDGVLSCDEFIDMLCPDGYRPTKTSVRATLPDGRPLSYVTATVHGPGGAQFFGWLLDDVVEELPESLKQAIDLRHPLREG